MTEQPARPAASPTARAQAPGGRQIGAEKRGAPALVAGLQPLGGREQSASERPEEIAPSVHQEERDEVLASAALLRGSMAQEPAHRGGPRTPRLDPRNHVSRGASAEEHLQFQQRPVESRAHTPAGRSRDQRLPVESVRPSIDDEIEIVVPEQAHERVMNGEVNGQIEEEILRTKAEGLLAGHSDPDGPVPDREPFPLVPRIPWVAHEPQVKVHVNAGRRLVKSRTVEGDVELKAVRIGQPAVTETEEEIVDAVEMLASDQQIEVGARTECRMGVEGFGERRPFERDHRDSLALEALKELAQLAAEDDLARDTVRKPPFELLPDGEWHGGWRLRPERKAQCRRQALGIGNREEVVPAQCGGRRRRLLTIQGTKGREEPADLRPRAMRPVTPCGTQRSRGPRAATPSAPATAPRMASTRRYATGTPSPRRSQPRLPAAAPRPGHRRGAGCRARAAVAAAGSASGASTGAPRAARRAEARARIPRTSGRSRGTGARRFRP